MADKKTGRNIAGKLGGLLLALVAAGAVYLAAVLLHSPSVTEKVVSPAPTAAPPVARMQAATMDDPAALARMFENRLPMLPGYKLNGQGVNTTYDGATARLVTLNYNGLTLSAVRPAAAAPLLLHGELDLSLRSDLTVLNLPAVLAAKGQAMCLYFSDENAAYSLYAPQVEEETFLGLLPHLNWAEP